MADMFRRRYYGERIGAVDPRINFQMRKDLFYNRAYPKT